MPLLTSVLMTFVELIFSKVSYIQFHLQQILSIFANLQVSYSFYPLSCTYHSSIRNHQKLKIPKEKNLSRINEPKSLNIQEKTGGPCNTTFNVNNQQEAQGC